MSQKPLSREEWRSAVLERDRHRCVSCDSAATTAHYILAGNLFPNGDCYISNGASLCDACHLHAEETRLSVEDIRRWAGIKNPVLPSGYSISERMDKWGNPILPDGRRMRGAIFEDPRTQEALTGGGVLQDFTSRLKYPRTFHLPWSEGAGSDDKVHRSTAALEDREIVALEKMDGENTTLYPDHLHARSLDSRHHPTRERVKALHARIAHEIPNGWRICGENVFAKHSIHYRSLEDHFLGFSIWNRRNVALSWDETEEWCSLLGLSTVPVLWRGPWDETIVRSLFRPVKDNGDEMEGYVVRPADAFPFGEFSHVVGKFVRSGHVQTDSHWMHGPVVRNGIRRR